MAFCSKDNLCSKSEEYCVYGTNVCMERDPWCIVIGAIDGPGIRNCNFPACDFEKYTTGCKDEDYLCVKHKSFPASGFCLPSTIKIPGQEDMKIDRWLLQVKAGKDNCNYACEGGDASCIPCPETWEEEKKIEV